jgi:uncharacterized lipoprotein YddW (UPF0748 family)
MKLPALPRWTRASHRRVGAHLSLLFAAAVALPRDAGFRWREPGVYPPPPVPREFRAAWISPIYDLNIRDWPSSSNLSADEQRAELRYQLDQAQAIGLNAVILHVRIAGDALYPTNLAPWSAFLTGTSGVAPKPAYDPLAFAISEAHARGLQLHAWFNPFRAAYPTLKGTTAASE